MAYIDTNRQRAQARWRGAQETNAYGHIIKRRIRKQLRPGKAPATPVPFFTCGQVIIAVIPTSARPVPS